MAKYLVKLCRLWESACEIEVEASTEQEAIMAAEGLELYEEAWTKPEVVEEYVINVEKGA
jgi:hypothetical protein